MVNFFNQYKVAISAAIDASKSIIEIYKGDFEPTLKEDGSPVTIADLSSSRIIKEYLEATNFPITEEESVKSDYSERQSWTKSWCVDPLDGTKEFLKKNDEFVINIALIEKQKPVFGLIASPINQQMILGGKDFGVFQINYEDAFQPERWIKLPQLPKVESPIHLISSRSHYSGDFLKLVQMIENNYEEVISHNMGSALKFFELVKNRADIYPRLAPTMEWDIAAGQAIYEAVGGRVINVETGESLVYNKENLKNPYFVAFNPSLNFSMDFYHN